MPSLAMPFQFWNAWTAADVLASSYVGVSL
jgi:hypothetical protein